MFLSYRTSEGKWLASTILRIENVNTRNLNFSYNCTAVNEGGIDTKSFLLLLKGVRNFIFGSRCKPRVLQLRGCITHHVLTLHTKNQAPERLRV